MIIRSKQESANSLLFSINLPTAQSSGFFSCYQPFSRSCVKVFCDLYIHRGACLEEMILSALLTSVGINLGLCVLFFTLYSILRKQPGNAFVYFPRLVDKQKSEGQGDEFNFDRLLPSADWVRSAWQLSEEDLLSSSGLDGLVFVRIFVFRSFKILAELF